MGSPLPSSRSTTSIQPFLDLNLGLASIFKKRAGKGGKGGQKLAQPLTLQKCLDTEYIQPEQCEYNCHSCENSEKKGRRYSTIKRLPNVLCIQFKVSILCPPTLDAPFSKF